MKSEKPQVIYVLGGPGCGKGTQCKLLLDQFPNRFVHISTGQLLRDATKVPDQNNEEIISLMKKGKMVPSKFLV